MEGRTAVRPSGITPDFHAAFKQTWYNPTEVGTGGTPFIPYLKKHLEETLEGQILPQPADN